MLINCTELAVKELLPEVLEQYKRTYGQVCTCQRCQEDIMALALNYLPPHYVATEKGYILTNVHLQQLGGRTAVLAQLCHAAHRVMENPRHNV
ncbi:MAG: late competence development ComFB family protein [Desulfurispora sp.]|uniref:late competence development ComFB family protein n=1 Tax=Desulfurispora sp. TaxID=3014275 RepID=UPI0040497457